MLLKEAASSELVPHLGRATYELVAPGPFHSVDAEVRAADPDGVFGSPRARGVVLRRDEPVPGVERSRDRSAEVDVAKAEHKVTCVEHGTEYVVYRREAVDPSDELDVPWRPRRVIANSCHVALDCESGRRVVPRQRQPDLAGWHDELAGRRDVLLNLPHQARQLRRFDDVGIGVDLQ